MSANKSIRICSVEGCDRKHWVKGFCRPHHRRFISYGDPMSDQPIRKKAPNGALLEWIRNLDFQVFYKCVEWPFSISSHGYGVVRYEGLYMHSHRAALLIHVGQPTGNRVHAAHNCHNRVCCNLNHVRWATAKENSADRIIDGTHNRGDRNHNAKLSSSDIQSIRADQRTQVDIAEQYGVGQPAISSIKLRKCWSWLD